MIKDTKTTIFDKPNLKPGTGIGKGIIDSNNPIMAPREASTAIKTIRFVLITG